MATTFVTVGASGQYGGIAEALEAAVEGGVSLENPWVITVEAGVYTSEGGPFEIPSGVTLRSEGIPA